ncbi:MAG TPA: ABC transporter ATP-binding protein [Bacillota bacterium]|nr:ABC transporter ATP-binding protein [Bacillota bacterium]
MEKQPLLNVSNLKTYFHVEDSTFKAVDGVTFHVDDGEIVAIVGESGSGKSMTSLSVMGLIQEPGKIEQGSIQFRGKELTKLSNKDMGNIRGNDIAMIFQEPMSSLNPVFTVGYQITEALRKHKKITKKEGFQRSVELLELVGFARPKDIANSYPHQLSGGMRQRAMIAMAMSCNPQLLIADEPTTALDVTIQAQILEVMLDVQKEFNSAILLITHDLGVVAETAHRVLVMYGGQIIEEASVEQVFDNPRHPYTQGLIKSIPKIDEEVERLEQITGTVPSSDEFPTGCRFAPRCEFATERCKEDPIPHVKINEGHYAKCILYDDSIIEQGDTKNEQSK